MSAPDFDVIAGRMGPEPPEIQIAAVAAMDRGWHIFPVKGKVPVTAHGLKDASASHAKVHTWWNMKRDRGIGLATGPVSGLWALDIDGPEAVDALRELQEEHGHLPPTVTSKTPRGHHLLFKCPAGVEIRNSAGKVAPKIDVRGDGGYIVVPPSLHPEGERYRWLEGRAPDEIPPATPPRWLLELVTAPSRNRTGHEEPVGDAIPEGTRNSTLASLAGTMRRRGMDEPAILAALLEENRVKCAPALDENEVRKIAASIARYDPAAEGGFSRRRGVSSKPGEKAVGTEDGDRDLTHDGLALDLGDRWAGTARHVAAWGRWYLWDGAIWREDETLEHMTRARAFLRGLADALGEQKIAKRLRRAETVAKVLSLARSNVAQAASVGEWDRNPWLLGTPGGTVDLRTGKLREADPADRITKATAVTPAPPGTACPLWSAFLDDITAGDEELRAFLCKFFGYALTGSVREHAFMFGHGTGANGKGVTVNTMMGSMGNYALAIPTEMLMASQTERHPTELARLRGVRLAVGSETEQGTRWAEAKIKALTGGDTIAARFMRRDFFEFDPTFKLVVVGNHRPSLRGVDEAMRRRLHFVRFPVRIPPERRNEKLEHDLEPEWPAILRWAIDGCIEWQEKGLRPPDSVRAATDSYLEAEDALAVWMDECCKEDPSAFEPIGELFASWKRWAEDAGEFVGSKKRFGQEIEDRGFERHRLGNVRVRGFKGLRLVSRASDDGGRR